ncbi:MAG: preprotein translocase subunit SecE [Acidobacteria bacterium]|nr:preprotein translocase subunit SecE [Acidobacteriota bacterium]
MKETKVGSTTIGREGKPSAPSGGFWSNLRTWPKETKTFLADVRAESKRVTWPSTQQIRATTVVVVLTVFFFGIYFGILDWVFSHAVGWLLRLGS